MFLQPFPSTHMIIVQHWRDTHIYKSDKNKYVYYVNIYNSLCSTSYLILLLMWCTQVREENVICSRQLFSFSEHLCCVVAHRGGYNTKECDYITGESCAVYNIILQDESYDNTREWNTLVLRMWYAIVIMLYICFTLHIACYTSFLKGVGCVMWDFFFFFFSLTLTAFIQFS